MKPPKSMRKAVRSFLGGKKKELEMDASQRVIEDTSVSSRSVRSHSSTCPQVEKVLRRSHSSLGERTVSLPSSTRQRIEEWNQNASPEFDPEIEEGMRRTLSAASKRSQEIRNLKRPPRQRSNPSTVSYGTRNSHARSLEGREITPWDSVSRTSSHVDPMSQRDSGTFDMYVNEEITSDEAFPTSSIDQSQEFNYPPSTLKRYSSDSHLYRDPKPLRRSRRTSFSSQKSLLDRTVSRSSNMSERLLGCMDTLEQLSKKLEGISMVNSEVEKFQKASSRAGSEANLQFEPKIPRKPVDWNIGNESISSPIYQNERKDRRRSLESSSTDSGVHSNFEFGSKSIADNPPTRLRNATPSNSFVAERDQTTKNNRRCRPRKDASLRSDSLSSGYSSGSGANKQAHIVPVNYYPQPHPAVCGHNGLSQEYSSNDARYPIANQSYPENGMEQYPMYGFNQGCVNEDPYGYGTLGYASSSVYDEDLNQRGGWFYLPTDPQSCDTSYQTPLPQYPQQTDYPPSADLYPLQMVAYPAQQSHYPTHIGSSMMSPQVWQEGSYGALSESFLNPATMVSPLSAAIAATCVDDHASIVSSEAGTDLKNFGSFRYRNGERTVVPNTGDSRRRKTVRFSRTVKQRVETDESEMEDSTSVIKGGAGGPEREYDSPSALKASIAAQPNDTSSQSALTEHTIYEFPSGHIESSCMCSDCILARGSCQLQPTGSFVYY